MQALRGAGGPGYPVQGWGGPGLSRQGPGFQGGPRAVQGVQSIRGEKTVKHEKSRKTRRSCVARLLRSSIQDFVQEVPVGQMAQGPTPYKDTILQVYER